MSHDHTSADAFSSIPPDYLLPLLSDESQLRAWAGSIVGGFHDSFIEVTQVLEMYKIGGFCKTEVMRSDAENITHQHPLVLSNLFHTLGASHALGSKSYQRASYT